MVQNLIQHRAAKLFKLAALAGDESAQLSYGLDLYYGSNGIEKDIELGLEYIRLSASSGIEAAREVLIEFGEH